MKILLVNTNSYKYLAPPPVGLTYIVKALRDSRHEVIVLDYLASKNPIKDLQNTLDKVNPSIVGFSIRNLDNQYMLNLMSPLPAIKESVMLVKSRGSITVLGGTAFTIFPEEMLQFMGADYGIAGPGEVSFPLLVDAIENRKDVKDIPGLVRLDEHNIVKNPFSIKGYKGLKSDWSDIDMKNYIKLAVMIPAASVIVKTGCNFQCLFCDTEVTMGKNLLYRDIDEIIDDIKSLKEKKKVKSFFLNDPNFNTSLDFIKDLLRRIIKENLDLRFMARLYPVPGGFDDEFFDLFIKAGGFFSMMGLDSLSDTMLNNYNKPFRVKDIIEFDRLATKYKFNYGIELLFGGPGENDATVNESLALLPKLNYSIFMYSIGIRINRFTKLYDIAKSEGVINNNTDLLFPTFYVSKDINVLKTKKRIDKVYFRYSYRHMRMMPIAFKNILEGFL